MVPSYSNDTKGCKWCGSWMDIDEKYCENCGKDSKGNKKTKKNKKKNKIKKSGGA